MFSYILTYIPEIFILLAPLYGGRSFGPNVLALSIFNETSYCSEKIYYENEIKLNWRLLHKNYVND